MRINSLSLSLTTLTQSTQQVDSQFVHNVSQDKLSSGLVTSESSLDLQARPTYFRHGILEIKCVAMMTILYEYETTEHLVTGSFKNKSVNRIPIWRKGRITLT